MSTINLQHSDKWSINFSNIPGYKPNARNNNDNMNLYDLFIKEVTFPDLSLALIKSDYRNYSINHQISKINDNLSELSVTFKLSEGMINYIHIFNWMKAMREQENINDEEWFRLNFIKAININFLDNQKRPTFKYIFENCFVTNLSSLTLTNGVDDEMTFSISITYEDLQVETMSC